jgi:hypothetical protein
MTKKTNRQEVIDSMLDLAEKEIIKNQIIADFYELQASEQDTETSAKTKLKANQVKQTVDFNVKFTEYLKSL